MQYFGSLEKIMARDSETCAARRSKWKHYCMHMAQWNNDNKQYKRIFVSMEIGCNFLNKNNSKMSLLNKFVNLLSSNKILSFSPSNCQLGRDFINLTIRSIIAAYYFLKCRLGKLLTIATLSIRPSNFCEF